MNHKQEEYKKIKKQISPGDIILVRANTWLSKAIRFISGEARSGEPGIVSHSGIFLTRARVGEMLMFKGYIERPLSVYLKKGVSFYVHRYMPLTIADRFVVSTWMRALGAHQYNSLGLLSTALDQLAEKFFRISWLSKYFISHKIAQYCSQGVALSYSEEIGYQWYNNEKVVKPQEMLPDDIYYHVEGSAAKGTGWKKICLNGIGTNR